MKKRILSVVLALTMVIGSFNVVFAGTDSAILIDADYAYATAYTECDDYTGFASTSCYPSSNVTSSSSFVSAKLYAYAASAVDSDSDNSSSAGTLNVSVELSYYVSNVSRISSNHSVTLDGVKTSTELNASN